MLIKCEACGASIGASDDIEDGQLVRCPHCGAQTTFHRPAHTETPDVAINRKTKPKLAIRRPTTAHGSNAAANESIAAFEARWRAAAGAKRWGKIKKLAGDLLSFFIVVALAAGGLIAWRSWKSGDADKEDELLEDAKTPISEAISNTNDTTGRSNAEQTKNPEIERRIKERFDRIVGQFGSSRLSFWQNLAKSKRPGAANGTFVVMIPVLRNRPDYFEIQSTKDGITSIRPVTEKGSGDPITKSEFEAKLNANGGLFLSDGTAYAFRPKSAQNGFQAPRQGEVLIPAKEYAGALWQTLEALKLDASRVSYDISFSYSDEPISVGTVEYGENIPYDAFRKVAESIAKAIQRKEASSVIKTKKYKRTVFLYNGHLIAKGAGGVTKVPMHYPRNRSTGYREWKQLHDEALRQESEAQRIAAEESKKAAEWKKKVNAPPDPQLVEKVLLAGKVVIKPIIKEK